MKIHQSLLDNGRIKKLTVALRTIAATNPALAEKFRTEADYFHRNALRMRYPKFRRLHLFVGSGVIEAGCKTVIGKRLKRVACSLEWDAVDRSANCLRRGTLEYPAPREPQS